MALLHCRKCQAEIVSDSTNCSRCGCEEPFICAECGQPIGMVVPIGGSYPFNAQGQPLCAKHARVVCDKCHKACDRESVVSRTVRWESVQGDVFPVNAAFCTECAPLHREPPKPQPKTAKRGCLPLLLLVVASMLLVPLSLTLWRR